MSYIPIIQRSDFPQYVKIGVNIKANELDLHIRDMQELEFLGWVDTTFYNDVMNIGVSTSRPELSDLINEYIKPYLVCGAYYKFLLWCGRDATQMGLRVENSESSSDVGDKARAELMADILRKSNAYLSKLKWKLRDVDYTFDNVVYGFYDETNKKEAQVNIGIKKVGKSQMYYDKTYCKWVR